MSTVCVKEEDTNSYEDIPVCVCGKRYVVLQVSQCYNGSGVQCDECGKLLPHADNVYHCPADKHNILHTQGYDVCVACYQKVSDEINTDNALFQIWFVINELNKELYHVLAQTFEINSAKSLISKSTNELFEFVASIEWNKFNDGTSRKSFCDSYDALRSKLLSLKQSAYKFEPQPQPPAPGPQPQLPQEPHFHSQPMNHSFVRHKGGSSKSAKRRSPASPKYFSRCLAPSSMSSSSIRQMQQQRVRHTSNSYSMNKMCNVSNMNYSAQRSHSNCFSSAATTTISKSFDLESMSRSFDADKCIGFSVGGSGDINTFRMNVKTHKVPNMSSITYEGIFNEYYFDTNPLPNDGDDDDFKATEGKQNEEELPCFYPSYSSSTSCVPAAIRKQNSTTTQATRGIFADMIGFDEEDDDQQYEHYLTVGLNSNVKERDFRRKKLNLVVVLDISGSMSCSFANDWNTKHTNSKMDVANKCLLLLLTQLKSDDRFGLVTFNNHSETKISMNYMKNLKMEQIESILDIRASGGTNFEAGYNGGTAMFDVFVDAEDEGNSSQYESRMIFLTDAHPNIGRRTGSDLLSLVEDAAKLKAIYTTFIGVGVDFNTDLISQLVKVRGANQFSVHSNKEFKKKLYAEFDYFVSPMVFDLRLTLFVEGSKGGVIEEVYGSDNIDVDNGEIMKINTLFPSPPNDDGDIKGGIVLIKLKKKCIQNKIPYFVQVTFEDKFGKRFKNKQRVLIPRYDAEYYPNLGVRKGLLLSHYVLFAKGWIESMDKKSSDTRAVCKEFMNHFQNEMKYLNDDTLKQEIEILQKLIAW